MKSKLNSKLKALKLQLNNCVMCAIKAPWETAELFNCTACILAAQAKAEEEYPKVCVNLQTDVR